MPTRIKTWGMAAGRPIRSAMMSRVAASSVMWVSAQVASRAGVHSSSTLEADPRIVWTVQSTTAIRVDRTRLDVVSIR